MTTHHPHPNDERTVDRQTAYSTVSTHFTEAAQDMRTMHTRLADLLDQVSVTNAPVAPETNTGEITTHETATHETATHETIADTPAHEEFSPAGFDTVADEFPIRQHVEETLFKRNQMGLDEPSEEVGTAAPLHSFVSLNGDSIGRPASIDEQSSDEIESTGMPDEPTKLSPDQGLARGIETSSSAITIKGRTDGIAIEIGAGSWRMLMVQLRHRLQQSSGFFRGGAVSLDVGERSLVDEDLRSAKEVLGEHGLNLSLVRSTSAETSQAAATLGIAVTVDRPEGSISQSALTNHESLAHFVYRGNLRSGQVLRRSETILVLGDINAGAHVESEGDILVWGRLRGIAHAGSAGDTKAIISAMLMEPTQLRISDAVAIMPASDERRTLFGIRKRNPNLAPRPEVAYITDGTIVVEPWDESKPGGIMAFRRS